MVQKPPLSGLPPAGTKRWIARRKAAVVVAVQHGLITREEVRRRYELSEEEFSSWQWSFETYGVGGLRIKHIQQDRGGHSARLAKAPSTAAAAPQQGSRAQLEEDCSDRLRDVPVPERI